MTPRGSSERVEMGATSGPWRVVENRHRSQRLRVAGSFDYQHVCQVNAGLTQRANARLIAAAPDHALLLAAIVSGRARIEPLGANVEVCTGGLRYATKLDENGCPLVSDVIRTALLRATVQR